MLKLNSFVKCSALALAFFVTAATIAEAQQRDGERGGQQSQRGGQRGGRRGFGGFPGGGFGAPDKVSLLGNSQIQTELRIASEQKLFLDDIIAEHRDKQREIFSGIDFGSLRDKSEEERAKVMADMQAKRDKLNKQAEVGLSEFLSEEQITRLDQIVLQLRGLRALTDDETGKKLAISADQKQKLEAVFEAEGENRRKMFEEMRGGGRDGGNQPGGRGNFDFNAMREKMEAARKKTEAEALAVLTADQKKQFDGMKGKPFELERRGFGGPGGFGGGRPGGGRQGGGRPEGDGGDRPRRPAAE